MKLLSVIILLEFCFSVSNAQAEAPAAFCIGRNYEAQFMGSISEIQQTTVRNHRKGRKCVFKISFDTFSPSIICPLKDRARLEKVFIKAWDLNQGCPEVGDPISGVIGITPDSDIDFDAQWEHKVINPD
jgi:hypothetical protein